MHEESYAINRANWDERAAAHILSPDYRVADLLADPKLISDVVRFDLPRLGDVDGLRGLHLQCHIGTDTVSLTRLGATMSGLDLSPKSVEQAQSLAAQAGVAIEYVVCDVYGAGTVFAPASFDLVYTGVGALCWLPDIQFNIFSITLVYQFPYAVVNDLVFICDTGSQQKVVFKIQVQLSFPGYHQLQEVEDIFPVQFAGITWHGRR